MKQHKLGEMAIVENSGVDKKIKDEEKGIRLCNMNIPKLRLLSFMFVGFLVVNSPHAVATPDYIESRYYTRVAEAQYAYLSEDYQQAYEILAQVEKEIPLLNNVGTEYSEEIPLYIKLCLRLGEYGKAYRYMRLLVGEHGYPAHSFDAYFNIENLKREPYYDSLELMRLEAAFQPDTALYS